MYGYLLNQFPTIIYLCLPLFLSGNTYIYVYNHIHTKLKTKCVSSFLIFQGNLHAVRQQSPALVTRGPGDAILRDMPRLVCEGCCHHRRGGFNNRSFFAHSAGGEAGSLRSRPAAPLLLRATREGSVPGRSPWCVDGHLLPVPSHCLPSVHVGIHISSCYTTMDQTISLCFVPELI